MVYKRRREEPVPNSDDDSELDSDEKEALEAFKNEGFNKDIEEKEAQRLKKVEDELDAKEQEKERAEKEETERRKRQKQAAENAANATPPQESVVPARPEDLVPEGSHSSQEMWSDHPNYKTKLCVRWQAGGCSFGERCGFAHGVHELRVHKGAAAVPLLPPTQVNMMAPPQYTDMTQQMMHQPALHAQHMAQQHIAHQYSQGHAPQYAQHHQQYPPTIPGYSYMDNQNAQPPAYPQAPAYNAVPQMPQYQGQHIQMQMPPGPPRIMQMPPGPPSKRPSQSVPLPQAPPPPPPPPPPQDPSHQ